jgi:putative ABC transport system ATP-binding protein
MIQIQDLEFRYPESDFVLCVSRLHVKAGERIALIGPSGSGKTTLLHLIAGIARPARGEVSVDGRLLSSLDDAGRRELRMTRIGIVLQEFELLDYLDVLDNILLPFRIHPAMVLSRSIRERAMDLARGVGIEDKLKRSAPRLSHGEKQRVALCRALIGRPPLVLADEPTGNLDPDNRARVLQLLHDYASDQGATLLMVTHDHQQLEGFDRVVDITALSADGTPEARP